MARKSVTKPFKTFDAANLAANATSSITNVENLDKASISIVFSGTAPVGVVTVEVRNGAKDSFQVLDMGSTINITGASGTHQLVFNELPFTELRLQYTRTSGTGTMDATFTGKVIGG